MSKQLLKLKDSTDNYTISKKDIFDLPMRLMISGPSNMGKTTILANLLLRDVFYKKDLSGKNIFIFSGSANEAKINTIIKQLDIPTSNIYPKYDKNVIHALYEQLVEEYEQDIYDKKKPSHSLFIFDDLAFENEFNKSHKNSPIERLYCNGRKYLISTITIVQKWTQLNTVCRAQITGAIIGKMPNSQLDSVEQDLNFLDNKKSFRKMLKDNLKEKHDAIIINLSNPSEETYLSKDFKPLTHT